MSKKSDIAFEEMKKHSNTGWEKFNYSLIGMTPLHVPDLRLALALNDTPALAVLDLGRDPDNAPRHLEEMARKSTAPFGIRLSPGLNPPLPQHARNWQWVVADVTCNWEPFMFTHRTLVQVKSLAEARQAVARGACGLIAKGNESGGSVGDESCFILLQRLLAEIHRVPIYAQGGIGRHSAAAAVAAGAAGVVLDTQLSLLRESSLPPSARELLQTLDGGETRVYGGYRVLAKAGLSEVDPAQLEPEQIRDRLGWEDPKTQFAPIGEEAGLAKTLAATYRTVDHLVHGFQQGIRGHLRQARALRSLAPGSPFARAQGTRFPIVQGPMTRVSDTAPFAAAVAEAGALPFLALSLLGETQARDLLLETRELLGEKPWGVGILGFAPAALRDIHKRLILETRPAAVLIAGGRPSQARPFEEAGIRTYLHVPAPGLLDMFLEDGARRFVFEGRECGGHVGPRSSFGLWDQQVERLLAFPRPEELSVLFAGGIHDARSASMVAALAAPLAARGAAVGVLMGSAYIATYEAVASGAVLADYQREVLDGERTVLLETAPGHTTRCLDTPYVTAFEQEKACLREADKDAQEIWQALENLNVGRLRLAAKGIERRGDDLISVDVQRRRSEGMYMIGQVAAMQRGTLSMAELHRRVSEDGTRLLEKIDDELIEVPASDGMQLAIVGMECVFPGASDLESYWANIVNGRDAVTEVPETRWRVDQYYDPQGTGSDGKTGCKWGGFIDPIPFDPLVYGIPPQSLAAIEPVQLLALEVARRALADAGYAERTFDRERTSVIFGAESGTDLSAGYGFRNLFKHYLGEIPPELDAALPKLSEDSFPGVLANVIAGRIANRLDLGGVNYTVDAACASSLAAVELAAKELMSGTSDMVLVGGADLHNGINDYLMFASVQALSRKGACRSFDSGADGIVLGEGVAVVVLKRLADAQADGDRIYAVLDGIAGASDGKSLGLTAPRKEGQTRTLARAYRMSGILPGEVGLMEAHGTGTVVGDRTELQALHEVFGDGGALPRSCALGSVKSQIGHTKCAAGLAGLIKCAKSLYHRVLPPTLHIREPNPGYGVGASPFVLANAAGPWPGERRRAAVSAFGFGGTNFHAVLSQAPEAGRQPEVGGQWPVELFLFRGGDRQVALRHMRTLAAFLEGDVPLRLRDLALTAACSGEGPVQVAFLAEDLNDLRQALGKALRAEPDVNRFEAETDAATDGVAGPKPIAYLFPGQGTQRPDMLRDLFVTFPELNGILEQGARWVDLLFPPAAYDSERRAAQQAAVTDTRVAQPVLGMTGLAMADLLRKFGVEPQMAGGHSYGELVALTVADALSRADLLTLSAQRAACILDAAPSDPGTMAAVVAGRAELENLLDDLEGIALANQNAPNQTVISGATDAVDRARVLLEDHGYTVKRIPVACAFHSPLIARAETAFANACLERAFAAPRFPVYANATARPYPENPAAIVDLLARHLVSPVRFQEQIERMYRAGARLFVEVGPGSVLTGLVGRILEGKPHRCLATHRLGEPGLPQLLRTLGQLAVLGHPVRIEPVLEERGAEVLDLSQGPAHLPRSVWWVDGMVARPKDGPLPVNGLQILSHPLSLGTSGQAPVPAHPSERDQVVHAYLQSVRDLVHAGREVMLGYLGATPAPALPSAAMISAEAEFGAPALPDAEANLAKANLAKANLAKAMAPSLDTKATLLTIVAERTGYPEDMLDLGLDLEADLSIDSIKRIEIIGELTRRLGLSGQFEADQDALMEQLAAKRTLQAMLDWLLDRVPAAEPVAEQAEQVAPPEKTRCVATLVLRIVSKRTGYPEDVLDLNLDLEADLSIDSIKRLEIVGELAEQLGFGKVGEGRRDSMMEVLASMKTLGAMVGWLEERAGQDTGDAGEPHSGSLEGPIPSSAMRDAATRAEMSRYLLAVDEVPEVVQGDHRLDGKHFLITDDTLGLAPILGDRLVRHGAEVRIITLGEKVPASFGRVDGLIHLAGLAPDAFVTDIKQCFELIRTLLINGAGYLLAAGGLGGRFGHFRGDAASPGADFSRGGGMAGLVKSVAKEWPELRAHWVDLNLGESAEDLAGYLEAELLADNPLTEVAYKQGNRRALKCVPTPLTDEVAAKVASLGLDHDSVIIITGGARGITAKIAIDLARRYGCTFELVGRSRRPTEPEDAELAAARDPQALRRLLIERHQGAVPSVIEAELKSVLSRREIEQTLQRMEALGAKVHYSAVDVRDIQAFEAFIDGVYDRHGTISGAIHGAGVVEDKLLRHKTRESFERVFDTKVSGALVLAKKLRRDTRFVVFFSSVAGAFGNRGQVDYAAANDVLDKIAHALQSQMEGRVVSINWGPWASHGMVSPELEREYARRGIGLISPETGVAAFMDELHRGHRGDTQVVWMCATPENMALA
ncbi:SDR family NAD(P)-dependent oxidoreductase [Sulfidibacter corallicola]|uniref:SDR family NAD(P)-dependent oxidoreductase n=1 Tax=Sulfidibacter corallicola TaxID=2818388 RepID=A0A8A4TSG3_SULCO|nr:type I polyketide synthase [Sulfidibacter corallicola]QTD52490.1 SDR family NAD(P)-dependent oxidoreductase [Sulfidibacter corallicola]